MDDSKLPRDLTSALATIQALEATVKRLATDNCELQRRVDWLVRQMFGRRSEGIDPNQLTLGFAPQPAPEPTPEPDPPVPPAAPASPASRNKGHGRRAIPENLPVRKKDLGPKACERLCPCHGLPMRCARVEVTKKLDYQPAEVFVVETHSEIAVCAHGGDAIAQTPAPPAIIDKGLAAPALLTFVVISKFLDHLPLYRINRVLARSGLPLPRSTLVGWIRQVAESVRPIYLEIQRQILLETFLQSDDTPVRVLRKAGGAFTGRFWAWRDVRNNRVWFEFSESRAGKFPSAFLANWKGRLQTDDYAGYDALYRTGRVVQFGCWAHARRKVFDALGNDRVRAQALLTPILHLFLIERGLEVLSSDDRAARRQKLSQPVLDEIQRLCADDARSVPPRSAFGIAVGYIQRNWKPLTRFVDDGDVPIHNNMIENAIRPLAIGRKNWLFAGSSEGGERAAILFTLVENCRRAGIDPEQYFRDVLSRLPTHPNRRIDEITPHGWKAARDREQAQALVARGIAA